MMDDLEPGSTAGSHFAPGNDDLRATPTTCANRPGDSSNESERPIVLALRTMLSELRLAARNDAVVTGSELVHWIRTLDVAINVIREEAP